MTKSYAVQQQNSVTKKWATLCELPTFDEAEKEYYSHIHDSRNIHYKHVFRMVELSIVHHNNG